MPRANSPPFLQAKPFAGVHVMDSSSRVGFRLGSFRSTQFWVLCLTAFATVWSTSGTASAQLRSGRAQRHFYQHELAASRNPQTPNSRRRQPAQRAEATSSVVAASYSDDAQSIVEDSVPGVQASPVQASPIHHAGTYHGSDCDSCGTGHAVVDNDFGCGAAGCGALGCGICRGGYSSIAPTCTTACPPGCGPLLALWYRLSVRAEVPLYWRRDQGAPILVTSANTGTGADVAGQIGESTTNILLGGDGALNDESNAGVRLTFGTWLGSARRYGVLFRYWNAGDQDDTFNFNSNNFSILARPFLNTTVAGSPEQDTQLISFPGESVGSIQVATSSSVDGLEVSLRRLLYMDRFTRVDWLYGYQHVSIDEGLTIASDTTVTGNVPALQGTSIAVTDRFETKNDFNGFAYGIMSTREFACWKIETLFRLGLGNLRREVNIRGSTTTASGGTTSTETQGLLARNTNSQPFVDDTFVVVPEVGINLAYRLRPGVDFNLGYNYLMIPKVAQAAQQIDNDLAVNLSDPLVGSLDPQLDFNERRYWLHSLGFGVQLRY